MLAVGGSLPVGPGYRAGLEATFSSGGYHSNDGGVETDLGTIHTGSLMLGLDGPIVSSVRWRVGVGGLLYWPSDETGIFLQGGTTRFLAGAGADFDYHRFTTDELERRGFSLTQPVSRLSLSVGLARSVQ
jgi:hypothetical protein